METQHTPGPWKEEEWDSKGSRMVISPSEGNQLIALIYGHTPEEQEANAQLIAAAPETAAERDRLKEELLSMTESRDYNAKMCLEEATKRKASQSLNSELLEALKEAKEQIAYLRGRLTSKEQHFTNPTTNEALLKIETEIKKASE